MTNVPAGTAATVFAFPADRDRWTNFGFQPLALRSAPATSSGSYQVTLPAGEYLLVATDRSRATDWQHPAFLDVASRAATRVTLEWGEPKTQDLRFVELAR